MNLSIEQTWQQHLTQRSHAVHLVRGILGCTCPETVFDHYQIRPRNVASLPLLELIMGDRLLVWIVDGQRISEPEPVLSRLLRSGLKERDRRRLNRFRLVLTGDVPSWEREWSYLAGELDPKVHLHVLPDIR